MYSCRCLLDIDTLPWPPAGHASACPNLPASQPASLGSSSSFACLLPLRHVVHRLRPAHPCCLARTTGPLQDLTFRHYLVKLKVTNETYQDEQKLRTSVVSVTPPNYAQEGKVGGCACVGGRAGGGVAGWQALGHRAIGAGSVVSGGQSGG